MEKEVLLEEFEIAMEQAVSLAQELVGTESENEITEKIYSLIHEVKNLVEGNE